MKLTANSPPKPSIGRRIVATVLVFATMLAVSSRAQAQEADTFKILKAMSDYLTSQSGFSAEFDVDLEVITPHVAHLVHADGKLTYSE